MFGQCGLSHTVQTLPSNPTLSGGAVSLSVAFNIAIYVKNRVQPHFLSNTIISRNNGRDFTAHYKPDCLFALYIIE